MARPRTEFPNSVKRDAHDRAAGICECHLIPHVFVEPCRRPLGIGNTFYEHIICDGIDGAPTLENCAVLTKTCWLYKTNTYDKPVVAKARRVGDIAKGIKGRTWRPLPGTRASGIKKPFGWSEPVDRATGQPIGRGR